ncbi:MAG: translocation/assembly module TamB domain-containing protein [Steroidobacter sp.]
MKWLKWTAIGIGGLVVLVIAFIAWVLNAESGTRWAAGIANNALGEKLEVGAVEGTIAGPLTVADIRYRDPAAGLDVTVQSIAVDVALMDLLRGVVHVEHAKASGIDLLLHEPAQPRTAPEESAPFTLEPPIDVVIDALAVGDVAIRREAETLLDLTTAAFAGHWTETDLAIERLDVRSPQGEIHFAGRVAQTDVYVGKGNGRFRWSVGEKTYAGSLQTIAEDRDVNLAVQLNQPLNAQLDVFLEQTDALPWRFTMEAPPFDPREELMPGSSLQSLAASLNGKGSLDAGTISGRLLINGEPLLLDPLRFTRDQENLSIESTVRIGEAAGEFHANGVVQLAREPWVAKVDASWSDVVVPAVWAGQELHTRGQLDLSGNPQTFSAEGALELGPPDRIANIALNINGSPAAIQLEQFDIVQKTGRLAATGRIDLQPNLAWNVTASGKGFDPGAFAVAWRGNLAFELASAGRITDEGPAGTLQLAGLRGELRGRKLSGSADLQLAPPLLIAGDLSLRSGESALGFHGKRGDELDAEVAFDIASLNDWLPESGGELTGDLAVRGRWPELSITGDARGRELNAMNVRIDALALNANIDDPRNPKGAVSLNLTRLTAAGFEFDTVQARASGAPDAHELELNATGEPLAMSLGVRGARTSDGWSGSLNALAFDIQDAARLALREPVQIVFAKSGLDVSRACLVDGDIELCVRGATRPDGALQASYSLAGVPLALANVFASSDLPLTFAGEIEGRGDIRRTAQGELFGDVQIRSSSGRVSRHLLETAEGGGAEEAQTLLSYSDLNIAANLSGPDARASLNARLDNGGSIGGEATVRGMGQAQTAVAGRLDANIPDLAPLAVFAPQLANVHGRADVRAGVSGTLQAPEIAGELNVTGLAADIPAVGLHLTNGRLQARPAEGGDFAVSGGVESGEGRIEFAGRAGPAGAIDLNINGDRFLAADIPGAHVVITPDLTFARADERMTLQGEVRIPEATVNLQKLPRGGRVQQASSDVVVIDAKTREDEVAEAPLFADVTIILGEKVELTGFGLQANLKGRLDVHEAPGESTTGSGEVRVAGRYKAYGQDLTIQQGQLLYAATPLDNPRLNIEATREVGEVTAGLRIRGDAQAPELTVFSDPPMGQANALSYLVAGKPLDDIGADEGEGDALQAATRSLGTAASGLLAKNIGRRLGVDEFAVKDDEVIGGAALTVGQYLSPRLYLSYGVGMFEPGEVVTLSYKLTEDLDVKAQRGPEDTRAGIEYRIEK